MIPQYFSEVGMGYQKYFDEQYPKVETCEQMRNQIALIENDILAIIDRSASNKTETHPSLKSNFGDKTGFLGNTYNLHDLHWANIRSKAHAYLVFIKEVKKKSYSLANCEVIIKSNTNTTKLNDTKIISNAPENSASKNIASNNKLFIVAGSVMAALAVLLIIKR